MTSHDPDIIATIARYEPEFFSYIEQVRNSNGSATINARARPKDKSLLWACLWYALERGVLVTVIPDVLHSPLPRSEPESLEIITELPEKPASEPLPPEKYVTGEYVDNEGYMKKRRKTQ